MAAEGNVDFGIATLVVEDQFSVTNFVGNRHNFQRHLAESIRRRQHRGKRVNHSCVKPTGNDNDVRIIGLDCGPHDAIHCMKIGSVTCTCR